MRKSPSQALRLGLALLAALAASPALATSTGCDHLTDGFFNSSNASLTDATEWGCSTVSKSGFAQVGNAGGAFLYADQGGGSPAPTELGFGSTLYLMYDYAAGDPGAFGAPNSFFDVFFEVVPDGHAYLVRIPEVGQLLAFERPIGDIAPLAPDGSFDLSSGSGWTPLTPDDLNLAQFHGAIGIGTSQNNPLPHPMAEFDLTIGQPGPAGHPGIYSPDPAFWSASAKAGGAGDPPISSGIFQLNPDGTTTVVPVFGPGGAPVMQGSVLPEPATFLLFAAGLAGMCAARRRVASSVLRHDSLLRRKP